MIHPQTLAVTAVAALVIAVLAFPRRPEAPAASVEPQQPALVVSSDVALTAGSAEPVGPAVVAASTAPATTTVPAAPGSSAAPAVKAAAAPAAAARPTAVAQRSPAATQPAAARPAKTPAPTWSELTAHLSDTEAAPAGVNASASTGSATAAAIETSARTGPLVTVTGCLEMSTDQDEFRLTETEGADAPKSRSWRSGFLRKRSAPVSFADGVDAASLKPSVGKRVAATGVMSGRSMSLDSMRIVAATCD